MLVALDVRSVGIQGFSSSRLAPGAICMLGGLGGHSCAALLKQTLGGVRKFGVGVFGQKGWLYGRPFTGLRPDNLQTQPLSSDFL